MSASLRTEFNYGFVLSAPTVQYAAFLRPMLRSVLSKQPVGTKLVADGERHGRTVHWEMLKQRDSFVLSGQSGENRSDPGTVLFDGITGKPIAYEDGRRGILFETPRNHKPQVLQVKQTLWVSPPATATLQGSVERAEVCLPFEAASQDDYRGKISNGTVGKLNLNLRFNRFLNTWVLNGSLTDKRVDAKVPSKPIRIFATFVRANAGSTQSMDWVAVYPGFDNNWRLQEFIVNETLRLEIIPPKAPSTQTTSKHNRDTTTPEIKMDFPDKPKA